ncbi:hypothetical protein FACS1894111_06100 [Clostridia bacterium]|nr:hypothetical protein FACS1894111_06100 [Clostridia bacterium]
MTFAEIEQKIKEKEKEKQTMQEKIQESSLALLELLNIAIGKIKEQMKEYANTPEELEKSIRVLNGIGADLERIQRLSLKKPLTDWE